MSEAVRQPGIGAYGSWSSPITSERIVSSAIGFGALALDRGDVYWIETRPTEQGRHVVVRRSADGSCRDVTPPGLNARTRVHEYGGGSVAVDGGTVYFSNFADQRLYRQDPGAAPRPLTPEAELRYADAVIEAARGRLICVREDHSGASREAENALVSLPLGGGEARVIARGSDFYSTPRLSPDGRRLAWLVWDHPNMPWDGSELWLADVQADGSLASPVRIAGGREESIFQPQWSPAGELHFVSDRSGWWNLYRWRGGAAQALCPRAAEFGVPQWSFGLSTYAFASATRIACVYRTQGFARLALLDAESGVLETLELPYSKIDELRVAAGRAVFVAASPIELPSVVSLDLATRRCEVLRRASESALDPGYVSEPRAIEFPSEGGRSAHAFFYAPRNRDWSAPPGERPPLLVMSHGGPTGATAPVLRLAVQFWTSRGIAVLDVNYGGSSGYGREYRQRLRGAWGIVDVDDCVNGARYLAGRGEVDGARLAITGGSAGGYTTLCALAFRDAFRAGASHYGVSDPIALCEETHKFESRYLDGLIGPYPERRDLYLARSPIHHVERLRAPVIFFQGLEDRIVPPNQSERMADALRKKGIPVAHVTFEGEQHGFRQAANIRRALDGELYFYSQVFGFEPGERLEPVPIENLPPR